MLTDVHCHPFDLAPLFPQCEEERRRLGVIAAASACNLEEFTYNEELAHKAADDVASALLPCFAVHPQLPAVKKERGISGSELIAEIDKLLELLDKLASEGRLCAVGECGFDLFNGSFRETEEIQDRIFETHMETAIKYNLPVVFHVRRAMHKIFNAEKKLLKCRAVVFHSWPGALEEGRALLRRGVNAYFSFGNTIQNGRKQSMQSCAFLPADRLLTETDAPFAAARGADCSSWTDLPRILETAANLRCEAGSGVCDVKDLKAQMEINFKTVFEKEFTQRRSGTEKV
jgi:TatD DNase family protein